MKKAAYCSALNTFLTWANPFYNLTCNYTVCVVSHSIPASYHAWD